eukprot:Colp12_sorted_trinity150504_noHs@19511
MTNCNMSSQGETEGEELRDCSICKQGFSAKFIFQHTQSCRQKQLEIRAESLRDQIDPRIITLFVDLHGRDVFPAISCILDNNSLYLGSQEALDASLLKENQITAVLNCAHDVTAMSLEHQRNANVSSFKHFRMKDGIRFDIYDYLHQGADFIHDCIQQKQQRVLVHCAMGVSRSCSVLVAYLVKYQNMTLLDALWLVKTKRSAVYPNKGFMFRLIEFEYELRGSASITNQHLDELHYCSMRIALPPRVYFGFN